MLTTVAQTLRHLIVTYQMNPLAFLYEADLQGWLFVRLLEALPRMIATRPGVLPRDTFADPESIQTSLVHTEYPSDRRFDIAIIDPHSVQSTEEYSREHGPGVLNEAVWNLRVAVGIELKHWFIGWRPQEPISGFMNDMCKLAAYLPYYRRAAVCGAFAGVACLFIQSCSPAVLEQLRARGLGNLEEWNGEINPGISGLVVAPSEPTLFTV